MTIWKTSPAVPFVAAPVRVASAVDLTTLPELRSALQAIPQETDPLSYDDWFRVACAVHHTTGGSDEGLEIFREFSARSVKHDDDFLESRIWPYLNDDRPTPITDRTILAMAAEHGWQPDVSSEFDDISDEEPADPTVTSQGKFTLVKAGQFALAQPFKWLVKGVLPAASGAPMLAVMYGASGSGKSFAITDLACSVARGLAWRGHRVTQGRVVYVCAEGAGGYRQRLRAYALHHGINLDDLEVWVLPAAPNLLEARDVKALVRAIQEVGPVALIVVDTLAQATPGGNENSSEDMGRAIGHCRTLSEVLHATVVLIHHSGKDDTKGARGHSSLKAAADTEIEVVRDEDRRAMRVSKQKDGREGQDMGFTLEDVSLGTDEDGDPVTSCVVVHNTDTVAGIRAGKGEKIGAVQKIMLQVLADFIGLTGDGRMGDKELINATAEKLEPGEGKQDRRKFRASRALEELVKRAALTSVDGFVRFAE